MSASPRFSLLYLIPAIGLILFCVVLAVVSGFCGYRETAGLKFQITFYALSAAYVLASLFSLIRLGLLAAGVEMCRKTVFVLFALYLMPLLVFIVCGVLYYINFAEWKSVALGYGNKLTIAICCTGGVVTLLSALVFPWKKSAPKVVSQKSITFGGSKLYASKPVSKMAPV